MAMAKKSLLLGALFLAGTTLAANAQGYYPTYPNNPAPPTLTRTPPSWSYDPYTSGMTACPQKGPWDNQPCSQIMPPTYGQPSYWPTR
jgi:hypothetical protein